MNGRDDWYRNTDWNESIATAFAEKLKRARDKEQYLCIQASCLARNHPDVAITLLDQYFQLPDKFDHATAHTTRAEALLALGKVEEAVASYQAALKREAEFPKLRTLAYVQYPYLVAVRCLSAHYADALEVLAHRKNDLLFPVDHFMWHAARAMIRAAQGFPQDAREDARVALEAAGQDHSGFRFHPKLGLVSDRHAEALHRLRAFHDA